MKLENQVCSLELAKKLKELRVEQNSIFDWCEIDDNDWILMRRKEAEFKKIIKRYGEMEGCVSSFTVAELGEMLPLETESHRTEKSKTWVCKNEEIVIGGNQTEADARAKMLCYLLKNKTNKAMKIENILKEAIKRGWKKEQIKRNSILAGKHKGIFIDRERVYFVFEKEDAFFFNLEEIEELKELCRVLWNEKFDVLASDEHISELIYLNSWEERKKYLENNFKQ